MFANRRAGAPTGSKRAKARIISVVGMDDKKTYMCIDMKSFFASVECAERGLNPMDTCLVVADETRGKGTICLAVSPKMKALGVKNRCRLFEVPKGIEYIIAPPRMQKYIDYAAEIYGIYLEFMSKNDIYVYSIDESFIDATAYLKLYGKTPRAFAKFLIEEIARRVNIPATAGVGSNLYLAKVALDITAKKSKDRIGYLDEAAFRETLWDHRPLTDFWGIARGTAARLKRYGIYTMRGITECPEALLYREFGINAELMIDHAYGRESCTMQDIKNYSPKSRSVSSSQVLFEDYDREKAKIVLEEMVRNGCLELVRRRLIAGNISVSVGYSAATLAAPTGGSARLDSATASFDKMMSAALAVYDRTALCGVPIRRLSVGFGSLSDESAEGYDLFTDWEEVAKRKSLERATLDIHGKFGKNALLTATDLREGATQRERNTLIGGHASGNEQKR